MKNTFLFMSLLALASIPALAESPRLGSGINSFGVPCHVTTEIEKNTSKVVNRIAYFPELARRKNAKKYGTEITKYIGIMYYSFNENGVIKDRILNTDGFQMVPFQKMITSGEGKLSVVDVNNIDELKEVFEEKLETLRRRGICQ